MAKASEDAEFDKENKKNEFDYAAFGFPSEFPYEFDSFGTEPVESVTGSTETESSDEEDFFAGLTRRLSHETRKQLTVPILNKTESKEEKTRGLAGSPQSTLSGIGSWSGRSDGSPNGSTRVPSPTTTPFSAANDAWDVLYAAAGQVARLKMNNEASKLDFQNRGLLGGLPPPIAAENRAAAAMFTNQNSLSQVQFHQQLLKQQQSGSSVWGRQVQNNKVRDFGYNNYQSVKNVRPLPRSAWYQHHPLQVKQQNHQMNGSGSRPVLQVGSGVKRGCGGTGVFLPRQYGAPPPESRKKTNCAPVMLPGKVHALNFNIDDLNARFSSDFGVDYDALLARRNALLMQQRLSLRREEAVNYDNIRLPQEWTY
ncbi:hypothetical protein SESBI_38516 [Sesbania bispinosa]|nr:hypothetical protein SESBI_38516 [Sesbania bispinosa]